ncbi:hypothetical protein NQ176_g11193 [Zarea fungicola]|uniref:Uncharacterized protein n=1 Tax=Zarea fungicola TaxID=93591 RepID=A0ACC1MBL0_9HYPO|nr:hypothetical protein NQ176_g11193 [Lecanicillium fungicola]
MLRNGRLDEARITKLPDKRRNLVFKKLVALLGITRSGKDGVVAGTEQGLAKCKAKVAGTAKDENFGHDEIVQLVNW